MATSQLRLDNKTGSPSEDDGFVLTASQPSQVERVKNASAELQSAVSNGVSIAPSKPPVPQFNPSVRGSENDFKFAPAPRHAPGHFTNRKIVERVDVPSEEKQTSSAQTSPTRNAVHNQPMQSTTIVPSPLSLVRTAGNAHKQSTLSKRIGLPFGRIQPSPVNDERHESPGQQALETAPADRPLASEENHRASNDVEIHSPPTSKLQSFNREVVSSVSAPRSLQPSSRPTLDVIMERSESEDFPAREEVPRRETLMDYPQPPVMSLEAQSNERLNPKRWVRDHQATQPRQVKQNHQMNRPVRLVSHRREKSRSSSATSSASGISKRTARSIRDLNVYRERDLPEVANKVNDLWKLCNNAVREAQIDSQSKVDKYRRKLFDKSQKLASYLETVNVQADAIQNLEAQQKDTAAYMERLKQQVNVYSEKVPGLVESCQTLKGLLESTLEDHKQYKMSVQCAIEELRAEKQREQSARELVDRQLGAVREHMKERIRQIELQCQEECQRVNDQMQFLRQQVEEKDSQARREREIAVQLSKQLAGFQETQPSLEDMRTQTSEIFKILSHRQSDEKLQQMGMVQAESTAKFNTMAERLEYLRGIMVPQSEAVSTLGGKQAEGFSRITSDLQTLHEAQTESKDAVKQLGKHLQARVDDMRQHLNTCEDTLTQQLDEKRRENGMLKGVIEEDKKERQSLEQKLQEANDARKAQEERIQDLVRKVDELQRLEADMPERLQQAEESRMLVVTQLDETRNKLEPAEKRERNEPGNISTLQAALNEAELRNQKLVEDLRHREAELEHDKTHFATLWNWAGNKAEAHGFDVDETWKDAQEASDPDTRWTCFLERILTKIDMHRSPSGQAPPVGVATPHAFASNLSQREAISNGSGHIITLSSAQEPVRSAKSEDSQVSQQNFSLRPPRNESRILGADLRRVMVQSPHPRALTPVPPSVEQEKSRRRGNQQKPKSSMKRLTRSTAHADELKLGQDLVSAGMLATGYGSLFTNAVLRPSETDEKEEIGMNNGSTPSGENESRNGQGGATAGSGTKTMTQSSKRSRKTSDSEPIEPFSSSVQPRKDQDLVVDDDDVPLVKRAKVQKPKASAGTRRGKSTSSQPKKQKPLSGLAGQGVVYGSFPPGVVQGGPHPPSEPKS